MRLKCLSLTAVHRRAVEDCLSAGKTSPSTTPATTKRSSQWIIIGRWWPQRKITKITSRSRWKCRRRSKYPRGMKMVLIARIRKTSTRTTPKGGAALRAYKRTRSSNSRVRPTLLRRNCCQDPSICLTRFQSTRRWKGGLSMRIVMMGLFRVNIYSSSRNAPNHDSLN